MGFENHGTLDEAIHEYRHAIQAKQRTTYLDHHGARFRLAECLARKGDFQEAVQEYRAFIRNYPNPSSEGVKNIEKAQKFLNEMGLPVFPK